MHQVGMRTTAVSISMALVLSVAPIVPVIAQQPGETEATSPEAFSSFSGGAAKAKRARTSDTASELGGGGSWVNLPDATLAYSNLVSEDIRHVQRLVFSRVREARCRSGIYSRACSKRRGL